jgi:hypothetical protein
MSNGKIKLKVSGKGDSDVGYVSLPGHPGSAPGVVKRSVQLRELMPDYVGPDLVLDFDAAGVLIGIEILG